MKGLVWPALLLWLAILPPSLSAFQLREGALLPSNYDLVKEADAIVLARAAECFKGKYDAYWVRFRILDVIKGPFVGKTVEAVGVETDVSRTDENDFSRPRDGARRGQGNAYDYGTGRLYVLFLRFYGGNGFVGGAPFSRINEEVDGPDSPWVQAVRHYVRIAALSDYEKEKAALTELGIKAAEPGRDKRIYPDGLADDIQRHFETPYPNKSYADLLKLYVLAKSESARANVLWAFAHGRHPEAVPLVRRLLKEGPLSDGELAAAARFVRRTHDPESVESLIRIASDPQRRERRSCVLLALRDAAGAGHVRGMKGLLELPDLSDEDALFLGVWFGARGMEEGRTLLRKRIGPPYEERDWCQIAALAATGAPEILDWARGILQAPKETGRFLACVAVSCSPLPEAVEVETTIMARKGSDLKDLAMGYRQSFVPRAIEQLERITSLGPQDEDLRMTVRDALREMLERGDNPRAQALLEKLKEGP